MIQDTISSYSALDFSSIPYGFCRCGCGQKTRIPLKNSYTEGRIKGEPVRFITGHHTRKRLVYKTITFDPCAVVCNVLDCANPVNAYGFCTYHRRKTRNWSEFSAHSKLSLEERFWTHVDKNGPIPTHCPELGPCYKWIPCKGYGYIRVGGKKIGAHRFAWELENGPMSPEKKACHHCDNPSCVRASHIYPGTSKDNVRDCIVRGRRSQEKLSWSKVSEIRIAYKNGGISLRALASIYNVNSSTIYMVVTMQRWISRQEVEEREGQL